jgi:beta-glucosidase
VAGQDLTVTVRVANTGSRPGRTVVQVYADRPDSTLERPVRWLAGFAAVQAEPGGEALATVVIPARAFQHWAVGDGWRVEAGSFGLAAGSSVGDLPLHTEVDVQPAG